MTYRITWADRLRAAWRRIPGWAIDVALIAIIVLSALAIGGCGDSAPAHGTAMEAAADANARAASDARAADQAAIDAADAKALADQLTAEAKANPTQKLIDQAVAARLDAAVKDARAKALDEQSQKATDAARVAQEHARVEHDAELAAADQRALVRQCRLLGLIGVAAGALFGAVLCYLTKRAAPGLPIGGTIVLVALLVVAYGQTVTWLPLVLGAAVVLGVATWLLVHLRERAVGVKLSQAVDALEGQSKTTIAEAKVQLGDAIQRAGLAKHFAKARSAWKATA